ncbi:hypothetical protein AB205_0083480 [Aquarana catesbeiana]|uniref:Spartin n=1 Tax=Aquarana catesbeiana TaxID=8400 RepID=A0A2G9SFX5_AQUCT|nr:hypothetical protein AB205_0083480 [Aquarana catesbeiana]
MEKQLLPEMQENALIRSIEEEYRRAFLYINKGLNADENGYKEDARNFYRQGQEHLLRGLGVSLQAPEYIGPAWDSARQMQVKMQETLQNVYTRLNILQQSMTGHVPEPSAAPALPLYPSLPVVEKERPGRPPLPKMPPFPAEPAGLIPCIPTDNPINPFTEGAIAPPAYTPQATDGHFTVSYGTESGEHSIVGDDFYSMTAQPPPVQSLGVDAEELILIPRGVQIFFVTPDGLVSAPSYPGYLRIIKFMDTDSEMAQNRPPAFLQVCDWLYPLMCTQSPVLRSNTGVYMFPDMMSETQGSYVGVVLSAELPAADLELFEDLLKQMSDLRIQVKERDHRYMLCRQRTRATCEETWQQANSRIFEERQGWEVSTGWRYGGFATVWLGLEYAGKNIAKSVATETVHTVKYKYGKDAGHATNDAVNSAINVGVTAFNIDHLGVKAIVKKTAKETSHAILDEYKLIEKPNKKKEPH